MAYSPLHFFDQEIEVKNPLNKAFLLTYMFRQGFFIYRGVTYGVKY